MSVCRGRTEGSAPAQCHCLKGTSVTNGMILDAGERGALLLPIGTPPLSPNNSSKLL